jgi:hypothetical protein
MFMLAFLVRAVYATAYEAIVFLALYAVAELLVWFAVRALWPQTAKHLDDTESMWLALVYNLMAFGMGLSVASYMLAVWPGLMSVAEALGAGSINEHLLWVDGTNARLFVVLAYLFVFVTFSAMPSLYILCATAFAVCAPIAVVVLRFDKHEPRALFHNLLFTSLSLLYFYASFVKPVRGAYLWNLLLAVSWYLFVLSMLVGFAF